MDPNVFMLWDKMSKIGLDHVSLACCTEAPGLIETLRLRLSAGRLPSRELAGQGLAMEER